MFSHGLTYLYGRFARARRRPFFGQIDLTYRCDFSCVHCYCKNIGPPAGELSTQEIKKIFDDIAEEGCLWLALSGGDPLTRPDFKEIYLYARQKGFILTILTNGYRLGATMIDFLKKYPPCSIDITLNSLREKVYCRITGLPRALNRVKKNIQSAAKAGLNLIIKANCLKENQNEIGMIKHWTESILGKPADNLYRFRYDKIIFPRLNGGKEPCRHRLDFKDMADVSREDKDMEKEYCRSLKTPVYRPRKKIHPLYACDTWKNAFFIDPFGRLKFCSHSEQFSSVLRRTSFRRGFYDIFPKIAQARFKTKSPCRTCDLRLYCISCPAIAYLETGDEEKPAEYFCRLAHQLEKEISLFQKQDENGRLR